MWHAGARLRLMVGDQPVWLGGRVFEGEEPQATVPAGTWQSAVAEHGWALVSCIVTPGFSFDGFELAPPDWDGPGSPAR